MKRCEPYQITIIEINRLKYENEYLKAENEKLQEKIDNFNKALEMLGGVK